MKRFIRITIVYYALMMVAFLTLLTVQGRLKIGAVNVADYGEEELATYRKTWEAMQSSILAWREKMLWTMILLWAVLLIISTVFILYVYFRLMKPIKEMESFSIEIARGNLEKPIPIYDDTLMSSFTESFDMMREALVNSKKREIEAEKSKKELVAGLSHDVKTPVATISATCEVMEAKFAQKRKLAGPDPAADAEISDALDKIRLISDKADTINRLINNMFHATLEELDSLAVNVSEVDTNVLARIFKKQDPTVELKLEGEIPGCLVYMDPLRMEQAIDNVISNSVKYAGTKISVSFSRVAGVAGEGEKTAPRFVKVTIRDYGPGADEEDVPRLAEKYYRGKTAANKQGYGLGLYLVDWYLKKQGGGLHFYNDHGFVVELLLREVS